MPHADDILAIQDQIEGGVETHLYLTDYRSLYMAELDEITASADTWERTCQEWTGQPHKLALFSWCPSRRWVAFAAPPGLVYSVTL